MENAAAEKQCHPGRAGSLLPAHAAAIRLCCEPPSPEVASHIQALVVAVEHVDCTTLLPRLPVQLTQQQHRPCKAATTGR